jgi:hypothetical protein
MAKQAAPNPFATASRKPTAATKKVAGNIFTPQDMTTYDGAKFSKDDIAGAITAYGEGHTMFEQGKAMKETNRPTILAVARTKQAEKWLMEGARPSSPKLHATDDGSGEFTTVIFMDSVVKMDDDRYANLANLIGAEAAEENTVRRDDFIINPELLGEKCKVFIDGKIQELTVMDAIGRALQTAFAPSPAVGSALFHTAAVFSTKKGLLDKGIQLVTSGKTPADAQRLAQFLEVGHFTTQVKPGGGPNE